MQSINQKSIYPVQMVSLPIFKGAVNGGFLGTIEGCAAANRHGLGSPAFKKAKEEWQRKQKAENAKEAQEGMNNLTVIRHEDKLVMDSREVAEMVGKLHGNLIRDIETYCKYLDSEDNSKLSSPTSSSFFILSTYQSEQNKTLPCYLITKKGCDMVANKLTGEKGVKFSAAYINRFYEMETALVAPPPKTLSPLEQLQLQVQVMRDLEQRQSEQQAAIEGVTQRLDNIGEILTLNPNGWRDESKKMIVKIAQKLGGNQFITEVYSEIYKVMLDRFGINLKVRRTNKRRKALEEGMPKSRAEGITYIDSIADDKKAIEAFLTIIKEMSILHGVDKAA